MSLVKRIAMWGSLVSFSHSIFALPFALMMVALVARERSVTPLQLILIVVCVVGARTAAMAFNRLVDAEIDARNPRTAGREIPRGVVSKRGAALLVLIGSVVFICSAWGLGTHCVVLSPLVLVVLLGYSLCKRFTSLSHFVLGVALALAPGGVYYALTGEWSWRPIPLMVTVTLWVAGFDILYSCQDIEFDRSQALFSIPAAVGVERAKVLAAAFHLLSIFVLIANGFVFGVGALYWIGVSVFATFVASQHRAVRAHGIGCINRVFFTRNGAASILLCVFASADALLG